MIISYNWLKDYLDTDLNPEELAEKITSVGLEVEEVKTYRSIPEGLENFVIGEVKEVWQHPNADKLRVTKVDVGRAELSQIVCGAPNVAPGQKVPVALPGTVVRPYKGDPFTIKSAKLRGEASEGMICAEDELGLGSDHEGILVLPQEVEVGKPLTSYFIPYNDHSIEIGLTPNRADAASHIGVARDIAALLRKKVKYPERQDIGNKKSPVEIVIEEPEMCPRYSGLTIRNIKVGPSPDWLQNRMKAVGLSPINNIVDLTNYVMYEMGQPMHAFDLRTIKGNKIIVKKAKPDSKFITLDKQERTLDGTELMICNAEEPMALAGVFGGLHSGISDSTTDIFIESAYFSPSAIRKSSRRHGLFTDASFRYERGADPDITVKALERIAKLILEIAGGEIDGWGDNFALPIGAKELYIRHAQVYRIAGQPIDINLVKEILTGLEFEISGEDEEGLKVIVPTYKYDVTREIDVIEEILRIYSFDNIEIPATVISTLQIDPAYTRQKRKYRISDYLASQGFHEAYHLTFVKEGALVADSATHVPVQNPLSNELGFVRNNLMLPGLQSVAHNLNRQQPDVKLFEWGAAHESRNGKYEQKNLLSLWATGSLADESWHTKPRPVDIQMIKAWIMNILKLAGLNNVSVSESSDKYFAYRIEFSAGGKAIGHAGLIHPDHTRAADIDKEVFYAELDADAILGDKGKASTQFSALSRFPRVERDLALIVPSSLNYGRIWEEIKALKIDTLQRISLFDVYEGQQVGEGRKSYAIRLVFEDKAKTLEDKVVDKAIERILQRLDENLGIKIR